MIMNKSHRRWVIISFQTGYVISVFVSVSFILSIEQALKSSHSSSFNPFGLYLFMEAPLKSRASFQREI